MVVKHVLQPGKYGTCSHNKPILRNMTMINLDFKGVTAKIPNWCAVEFQKWAVKFCNFEIWYKEFKAIFTDFHLRLTNIKGDPCVALSLHVQEFKKIAKPISYDTSH
jgi:hypothetical protein